MKGYIHSIETFGTVDGPGIRYVIFMQGCQFRCAYCHNPDTWNMSKGKECSADELVEDILKYRRYIEGVTVSGGEPLLQIEFITELFEKLKKENLTTCIDTNGGVYDSSNKELVDKLNNLMKVTDLVLLDIKHIDNKKHENLTGNSNKNVLEFADYLSKKNIDVWLRYVLVPTINNDKVSLFEWKKFSDTLKNVKKIEILPYHKMAIEKYKAMNIPYTIENINEPTKEDMELAYRILIKGEKI